jgi:pimeloyl-ACP methyl ester carboxylesterase
MLGATTTTTQGHAMIHSERGGSGRAAFLLLHGLGATGAVWAALCARIETTGLGRWIVVDLPGHGASERRELYSIGRFAADLAPLVTDEQRAFVVGHSLGAYIALALASGWFRARVAGVLGIGPKITWTEADLQGVQDLAARPPRDFATEAEAIERYRRVSGLDTRFAGPDVLARGVRRTGRGYGLAADPRTMLVAGASFATLASSATCPVILARGEHDPMVSLAELRDHATDALDVAGRGHNAHVEDAQAVAALCERLVRRT